MYGEKAFVSSVEGTGRGRLVRRGGCHRYVVVPCPYTDGCSSSPCAVPAVSGMCGRLRLWPPVPCAVQLVRCAICARGNLITPLYREHPAVTCSPSHVVPSRKKIDVPSRANLSLD